MVLDESLPYGQVSGIVGVAFEQGGRYFNASGRPVRIDPGDVVVELDVTDEAAVVTQGPRDLVFAPDVARFSASAPVTDVTPEETGVTIGGRDWRTVSNDELKAQLLIYGQEWTGRKDAIAFVRSTMDIG